MTSASFDYKKEYQKAKNVYIDKNYTNCVLQCGIISENAFKDLFQELESRDKYYQYLGNRLSEFIESFEKSIDFKLVNAGFFDVIKFFEHAQLWDTISRDVESNLHFTRKIPWHDLRQLRNKAAHPIRGYEISREDAMEFMHYLKIFLIECELIPDEKNGPFHPVSENCNNCNNSLKEEWRFCPNCGSQHVLKCTVCNKRLEADWRICPYCNNTELDNKTQIGPDLLYKVYCEAIWADHHVNADERLFLKRKRLELGLTERQAEKIEESVAPTEYLTFIELIEAVLLDGIIDDQEMEFLFVKAKRLNLDKQTAKDLINNMVEKNRFVPKLKLL